MKQFSVGQLKALSGICGNISVAWFAAGFIGPIINNNVKNDKIIITIVISLMMAILFTFTSLFIVKKVKS